MKTIETPQAPSAKPKASLLKVTTVFQSIAEVENYLIPEIGFSSDTRNAPGIVEITSPLTVCNVSSNTQTFDVRFVRTELDADGNIVNNNNDNNIYFDIMVATPIEPNEIIYVPLNGQFLNSQTEDRIQIKCSEDETVNALLSFTQGQAEEDSPYGEDGPDF